MPAIGRTLQFDNKTVTVIGLAADVRFDDIRTPPPRTVYVPFRQHGQHVATFALRTAGNPADLIPVVEKAVARIAPEVPPYNVRTQEQQIEDAVRRERLFASLVSGFAVVGALLACLGIYGTLAYSVARRTSEIGLRVALGARSASVVWLILRESVWPVVAGLARRPRRRTGAHPSDREHAVRADAAGPGHLRHRRRAAPCQRDRRRLDSLPPRRATRSDDGSPLRVTSRPN